MPPSNGLGARPGGMMQHGASKGAGGVRKRLSQRMPLLLVSCHLPVWCRCHPRSRIPAPLSDQPTEVRHSLRCALPPLRALFSQEGSSKNPEERSPILHTPQQPKVG